MKAQGYGHVHSGDISGWAPTNPRFKRPACADRPALATPKVKGRLFAQKSQTTVKPIDYSLGTVIPVHTAEAKARETNNADEISTLINARFEALNKRLVRRAT